MEYRDGILQVTGIVKGAAIKLDRNNDKKLKVTLEFVGSEAEAVAEVNKFVTAETSTTVMFTAIKGK